MRPIAAAFVVTVLALDVVAALSACAGPAAMPDGGTDSGARIRTREALPEPLPLEAGFAQVRIPAPLGIGTMGYAPFGAAPSVTPFAEIFPGTTRVHGTVTFRAVALWRGEAFEAIVVRLDTIGIFQHLREAVLDELERQIGRRLDDALILAANHTHSGPGRLLMTSGVLRNLGDTFLPEFYDAVVDALADVVERALADRRPAEIATVMAATSEAHADRRCENDPLDQPQEIPDMPVIAIRREGRIEALVASYAYHGTVLGIDAHTLTGDMGATVEQKVEERFAHPVMVLFLNSWGGDMSPGRPDAERA